MDFKNLIGKDITVHTDTHAYRGELISIINSKMVKGMKSIVLYFKKGIDEFYIDTGVIVAVTVHGIEHI